MSKKKLIPELRFPEFVKDGEWAQECVGQLYNFIVTNSLSRDNLNYKDGKVKNIHYGDIHTKFNTLFDIDKESVPYINSDFPISTIREEQYCIEGDMVFADASEDLQDVGKSIEIINLGKTKLVSGLHTLLARQKKEKLSNGFGGYLFKSDSVRRQIQREAQGAKVLGISATRLSNVKVPYPKTQEQQKIASCLSSLDELIAAHTQKLEVLNDHKKGLMQNLFPKEGQKVPKYRFPEFEKDGEWMEKELGTLGQFLGGGTPSRSNGGFWIGNIPWISSSDISDDDIHNISITRFINNTAIKESATKLIPKGSVLFVSRVGVGKLAINKIELCTSQDFTSFLPDKDVSNYFVGYYFSSNKDLLQSLNQGTSIKGFSKSDLESLKLSYPNNPNEQTRIASCLSAVDGLITEQTEKLEQLQLYKKGLMQGLFPQIEN